MWLMACIAMRLRQVIDLISLKPFDMETISNSVMKTRKVVIVEECMKTGGIGASLSATINESLFDHLDHQVRAGARSKTMGSVHGLRSLGLWGLVFAGRLGHWAVPPPPHPENLG